MSKNNFGISINTMFQYDGCGCHCVKDTVNTAPDEEPMTTLKICPDISRACLFSYVPKDGLDMTGVAGAVQEKKHPWETACYSQG